jgi:hypothetical protein
MGMMARFTRSDVSVIALIGERGREVKEFLDNDLGEEGLARSCVVAATSDTPPLARLRGAYLATAIAEYFRDQGKHVLCSWTPLPALPWPPGKSAWPSVNLPRLGDIRPRCSPACPDFVRGRGPARAKAA